MDLSGCIEPPLELLPAERGTGIAAIFWEPGEVISIAFLDGFDDQRRLVMEQVGASWEPYINLSLLWNVDPSVADVRITFAQPGAWSYMGTDCRKVAYPNPTMNLGFFEADRDGYDRIILHEFGHMLGMHHEQEHPDEDIPWKDGTPPPGYYSPHGKVDPALLESTPFDTESVMIYFVSNKMTEGNYTIPVNFRVSNGDIAWMQTIYNVPEPKPEPPEPDIDVDIDEDKTGMTIKIFIPKI